MRLFFILSLLLFARFTQAQPLYYPPLTGTAWSTTDPASLGWCSDRIDSLYTFLAAKHTRAFLVLKDGRIVLETYFGTFTADSFHAWASAGKTLAAFTAGVAQRDGLLHLTDPVSQYLGTGWTSELPAKEALITLRNQLTMTSGLDDGAGNPDCTLPSCLTYKADAGTRWAYHNAPYTLIQRVVDSAAGPVSWQQYYNTRVALKTGITGQWVSTNGFNSVFFSKPRAAARFGLLLLGRGVWDGDTVLKDTGYMNAMTHPSQPLNPAYGYLTWLNGSTTYRLPGTQVLFNGPLIPAAPADLYAALGKDDQKIYVAPSQRLVVVRLGDAADSSREAPSSFDNDLWLRLNALACAPTGIPHAPQASGRWQIHCQAGASGTAVSGLDTGTQRVYLFDPAGRLVQTAVVAAAEAFFDVSGLPAGLYIVSDGHRGQAFQKQ